MVVMIIQHNNKSRRRVLLSHPSPSSIVIIIIKSSWRAQLQHLPTPEALLLYNCLCPAVVVPHISNSSCSCGGCSLLLLLHHRCCRRGVGSSRRPPAHQQPAGAGAQRAGKPAPPSVLVRCCHRRRVPSLLLRLRRRRCGVLLFLGARRLLQAGPLEAGLERVQPVEDVAQRPLHQLAQHVHLHVHLVPQAFAGNNNVFLGVSYQHEVEPSFSNICFANSQACPINGNEALGHDVPHQLPRDSHPHPERVPLRPHLQDRARLVHVALDEVAGVPRVRRQGPLQVHPLARFKQGQVGPTQRLRGKPDTEAFVVKFNNCQTHTIYCNGSTIISPIKYSAI
mmetsp:Transcript_22705/g.31458  ORF Transcript_22705/g.31458 Transcript_22705/m.31458 type:complete len:338 (+) Transcript_22705:124-1137(+)